MAGGPASPPSGSPGPGPGSSSSDDGALRAAKRALRAQVGARRAALSPRALAEASTAARAHLTRFAPVAAALARPGAIVALYAARRDELDPWPLVPADAPPVRCAFPRVVARGAPLVFHVATPDALVPATFGLREPPADAPTAPLESASVVVVPGVAFDRQGGRLGYGGGFYDRSLPARATGVWCVGFAHSAQVVPVVPRGPHDREVDALVTEDGVLCFRAPDE
jgi:5-formyltetrahydrofolate cyclo-ligase